MTYQEICLPETLEVMASIMNSMPAEKKKPFGRVTENEISKEDKAFILKIMKLDPRDRPSARELLEDKWFDRA
jgi:serine/threonine protein kinase